MSSVRKYTNTILRLCDEGIISWQSIAEMALSYMSEDEVRDMYKTNNLNEFVEVDEDE